MCDGCKRRLPMVGGRHAISNSFGETTHFIECTKSRYVEEGKKCCEKCYCEGDFTNRIDCINAFCICHAPEETKISSPTQEKKCEHEQDGLGYCVHCKECIAFSDLSSSPVKEGIREDFDESFRAFNKEYPNTHRLIADWWLNILSEETEKVKNMCLHADDRKVTENFNRGLKDENSELVEIIKEVARKEERERIVKEIENAKVKSGHIFSRSLDGERSTDYNAGLVKAIQLAQKEL